jgi:putative flippase GtrA
MARFDRLLRQACRYFLTGGAAAIVDAGGFWLLLHIGLPPFAAAVTSFTIAAIVNYTLSSLFAFGHELSFQKFVAFLLFALLGLAINVTVTLLAIHLLPIPPILCKIIGIGVAFVANFLVNALLVFRTTHTD